MMLAMSCVSWTALRVVCSWNVEGVIRVDRYQTSFTI